MATVVSQDLVGDQNIDGLFSGFKWSGTVTYSFTNAASDYPVDYGDGEPLMGFAAVSWGEQLLVDRIMTQIEDLTDLVIMRNDEVAISDGAADIRIAKSSAANPTSYSYYPSDFPDGSGGDVWFGTADPDLSNPRIGNYAYATHLHELGHAFGLKHPHETENGTTATPAADDGLEYSVMSYRSYPGQGLDVGFLTNELWGFPQSYMRNDILALQKMYGADFGLNGGNTVYRWDAATGHMSITNDNQFVQQDTPGANRVFLTIWDGDGNDTYDMSNYSTPVSIDLQPGLWSTTSNEQKAYLGNGHYAQGNVYNAFQYNDDPRSLIENAIGGSGEDTIIGNIADNMLEGRDGDDTLTGGAGDDRFVVWQGGGADVFTDFVAGGTEDDIYIGLSAVRSFAVLMSLASQQGDDAFFDFGAAGSITLSDVLLENLTVDDFVFINPAPVTNNGGPYYMALSNASVSESAIGGAIGSVTVMDADGDTDFTFDISEGRFEVVHDWFGNYTLKLKSGIQIDKEVEPSVDIEITVKDLAGHSYQKQFTIEVIDGAGVTIAGTIGNDWIDATHTIAGQPLPTVNADTINGLQGNDTIYAGAGNDTITGGLGDDYLYGDDGDDSLLGREGNDYLYGGEGNDVLMGDAGNDYLYGHAANDTFNGGAGEDLLDGGAGNDIFIVSGSEAVVDTIRGGAGIDSIQVQGAAPVVLYGFNCYTNLIEVWDGVGNVLGTSADNIFDFRLLTSANMFFLDAGAGNDILHGPASSAQLKGGLGSDFIYGGAGNDLLYGQAGADLVDGGDGNDTIYISAAEASFDEMHGGGGYDTLSVVGKGKVTLSWFAETSIESWVGNNSGVVGTKLGDVLDFSELTSKSNMGYIDGGSGNDIVVGSTLADDLRGNGGNDTLNGGGGNDLLNGGKGVDTFIFNGDFGNDTIAGFAAGTASSHDFIQFDDAQFANFADVMAHAAQVGTTVVITLDPTNSVTLQAMTLVKLVEADFQFV